MAEERFQFEGYKGGSWSEIEQFQDERELRIYALNGFKFNQLRKAGFTKVRTIDLKSGAVHSEKKLTGLSRWLPF